MSDIELDVCPPEYVYLDSCAEIEYQIYRIITGPPSDPESIIIFFDDYTFRILKKGTFTLI